MPAGNEREVALRVAEELCAELGYGEDAAEVPGARSPLAAGGGMSGVLSAEEESLVLELRSALAKIAAAVGPVGTGGEGAVGAALDGAEMVIRGGLLSGNAEQLASLMPSFVFLVTLPIVEQDRALELSRRTSELIERALGS